MLRDQLRYYADADLYHPKGSIRLTETERPSSPSTYPGVPTPYSLDLRTAHKTMVLCADTQEELELWLGALSRVAIRTSAGGDHAVPDSLRFARSSTGLASSSTAPAPAGASTAHGLTPSPVPTLSGRSAKHSLIRQETSTMLDIEIGYNTLPISVLFSQFGPSLH